MRVLRVIGVVGLCLFVAVMGVGGYLHWWPWYVAGFWVNAVNVAMFIWRKRVDRLRTRAPATTERAE